MCSQLSERPGNTPSACAPDMPEGAEQSGSLSTRDLFIVLEKPLLHYAMRYADTAETAQDAVQEAFLRLHQRREADHITQPRAWLYTTTRNYCLNHYRKTKREVAYLSESSGNPRHPDAGGGANTTTPAGTLAIDPALSGANSQTARHPRAAQQADSNPGSHLEHSELLGHIRQHVRKLNPNAQEVIRLKFEEGLPYKDIARATGLTTGNVGYILHHALKELNEELRKGGLIES